MTSQSPWRSPLASWSLLFAASFVIAFAITSRWQHPEPRTPPATLATPAGNVAPAGATAPAVDQPEAPRTPAPLEERAEEPTFEARIDELVRIGQQTAAHAAQDEQENAIASDKVARERFSDLMGKFEDAGERSLSMLMTQPDDQAAQTTGRRIVLQLVLRTECERRDAAAVAAGDRSRIDRLVQSTLDVMPTTNVTTTAGAFALVQQRFLRSCHEPSVLELVHLAGEQRFSREVATKLLLTLWDNLQQYGERSSDAMSRLALLLLGNSDASQRTAAYRQLLRDARYRGIVLAWIRDKRDEAVANEIGGIAANELPAKEAIEILRELAPVMREAATPFLTLGFRAPDELADGYRELLATNTEPGVRRDMVIGIGLPDTPLGREIAQLALENDPDVDVRMHAVIALSARKDPDVGERAITRALDDPAIARDPLRLGELMCALQNLASSGQINAVDRLGVRLRTMPLRDDSRKTLEAILARSLPGGRSALPAVPR